ncbi:MAG TPA: outer membrane protein assembly factor BamA [Rhizobiaceae bacterium]|nr:outer membrane protein assembly factor BamA [Rhizobiaceae bacterium]
MKPALKVLSAVWAVALSVGLALPAAAVIQFATVQSAQAAVVSSIDVQGNQRVDDETIINYVGIRPGVSFDGGDIDEGVKKLFATGLFGDVQINQRGSTLVIVVSEYMVVNQVLFQGNKKIKDAQLASQVQTQPRGSFSQATVDADIETIKQAYSKIGRDDAVVTSQVIELGENRVNVVFEINEGDRTKIAAINFIGNNAFSDRRLSDVISTKRSTILSVLLRDDIYDEDRLRADEEALRRFYYNRGYADFQVVSAFGELDESTNKYTVTITVEEGDRYNFGAVSVENALEGVDQATLDGLVESRSGDTYSAKDVEDTILALTEHVAGLGYAFAEVTPRGDRDFENRTINVTYVIDQGARTYIERIEIRGNVRTRDYVIRREFDVTEGDAFNQVLIQRAKRRLETLDFFETVEISTAPGTQPDQVVLVVDVVEKSTGEFSIGGGYATGGETGGGFSVEGSITERNFLGRGQFIRVSAGAGRRSRDFTFSFTEPYFLGRRISAGFDIFRNRREYTNYESETTGATVRFGLPITEALSTQLAYNFASERYKFNDNCDVNGNGVIDPGECVVSQAIVEAVGVSPWTKSSISAGLTYNTIDDMKNPHEGIYATFTTEFAGVGGDAKWVKLSGRASVYYTLSEEQDIVGLLTASGGHIIGYGDEGLRIFDLFQNNDRMVRGFEYNGMGPADNLGGGRFDHLGGTTYFAGTAEVQFPLPVVPQSFGLKGAVFADAGTLYGNPSAFADTSVGMALRASVGAGIIWASPFGPIRVDYAFPLLKEDSDNVQNFNFGISTRF